MGIHLHAAGPVELFDGKTLNGWERQQGIAEFRVEDGMIIGKTVKNAGNTFLCTTKHYADFDLTFETKFLGKPSNSGCQIRALIRTEDGDKNYMKKGYLYGPQVEIEASGENGSESGNIYGQGLGTDFLKPKKGRVKAIKDREWNHIRILAEGPRIRTWINGEAIIDLTNEEIYVDHSSGMIGLQMHGVKNFIAPQEIAWRNIRITELDGGAAPVVLEEATSLKQMLGTVDQAKLEEYLETLRDLEARIEQLEKWKNVPTPAFDAEHIALDVNQEAAGKYLQSMVDLMILAFQIDATRVASYMIDREESKGKARFSIYGNHHGLSHGKTEKTFANWSKLDRYLLSELKVIIEKLKNSEDAHGPLLDSTVVYWGGANSTYHNARNYPLILAGGHGMGFKHGRYLRFGEDVPLSNLYVSLLDALGVPNQGFSDSTGRLEDVFA